MNERPGLTFLLSFLLVGFAAVILYRPDPPRAPRPSEVPRDEAEVYVAGESPADVVATSAPVATSGVPWPEERDPSPSRIPPVTTTAREPSARSEAPLARASASRSEPRGVPNSPFATVLEGESLEDVAVRVYGSADASRELWLANRDQVERLDEPLKAGTTLRTPVLTR